MINSEFRKKMADNWFSYIQMQICKSFEQLENNKLQFTKRDWHKKKISEGGGTSYLLTGGKIFDKVGVNKSTVSGVFPRKFRSKILGAEKKGKGAIAFNGKLLDIVSIKQAQNIVEIDSMIKNDREDK